MSSAIFDAVWSACRGVSDQLQLSSLVIYGALFLGSWLFYLAAIEPFLSPLRKVPGMPYNPFVGNLFFLMKGEGMEATIKMMKRCGPIFRYYMMFGRVRLGLADPDAIRHVTITNSRNYIKPPSRIDALRMVLGNGLVTSEGNIHATHKRLMSPAFNNQSISKLIPTFERRILKLVNHWKAQVDEGSTEFAVTADLARTTLDIIGETAFGYEFNSLEDPDHEISKAFRDILSGAGISIRFFIPFYFRLPFPDVLRFRKNIKMMRTVVDDIITQKRKLIETGNDASVVTKDVLGMMMAARDETSGQGLSDMELRDQVMTLMGAGHETTSTGMSWCLLMLASNAAIQEKARQEVISVLHDDEPLTFENLEKLEYCGWIIKETLRLLPPVAITIRQALSADVLPGDIKISPGTVMTLCIGPMMRRPDIYEDPDSFRPERFEQKETEASFHSYLPFLIGPRMCLGHRFALIEMRAFLAVFLRHLRFDMVSGMAYKRKFAFTMRPDPPLKLRVSVI